MFKTGPRQFVQRSELEEDIAKIFVELAIKLFTKEKIIVVGRWALFNNYIFKVVKEK